MLLGPLRTGWSEGLSALPKEKTWCRWLLDDTLSDFHSPKCSKADPATAPRLTETRATYTIVCRPGLKKNTAFELISGFLLGHGKREKGWKKC